MDVWERLANEIKVLPKEIQNAWEEASIEAVDEAATKLYNFFINNSGSDTLNSQIDVLSNKIEHEYYEKTVDWDDTIPVNLIQKKSYGRDANKPRAPKKRNYSLRPATSHDLAYIISVGQEGIAGNQFIKRGTRRIKNWRKNRDVKFQTKLDMLGKNKLEK